MADDAGAVGHAKMLAKFSAARRGKAGRSAFAVALRRKLFVEHYIVNGHNATQAAISVGIKPSAARQCGWRILHEPAVQARLIARAREIAATSGWLVDGSRA